MAHRRGTAAILALAAVCLLAAGVGGYARYAVLDEGEFAQRALSTLRSDEVRDEVGARVGRRLAGARPELSLDEPMIEDAVAEAVVPDPRFRAAFRAGAARLQRALFGDPDAEASMTVAGSGAMVEAELERRLTAVPRLQDVRLFTIGGEGRERTLRRPWPPSAG